MTSIRLSSFLALSATLAASIARGQSAPPPVPVPAPTTAPADLPDGPEGTSPIQPPLVPTGPTALIETSLGRLTCKLYEKQAPITVANFIGLAQGTKDWVDPVTEKKQHAKPFYNGTTFHRVIPSFMIQGGDRAGDGTGDPGYLFQDEIVPALNFDVPGRLAMANSGPSTNGSQFFITEAPTEQLDGKHTIFGQCDAQTVARVAAIARVERSATDKPLTPVVINKIVIVPVGQPIPAEPPSPALPSTASPVSH